MRYCEHGTPLDQRCFLCEGRTIYSEDDYRESSLWTVGLMLLLYIALAFVALSFVLPPMVDAMRSM